MGELPERLCPVAWIAKMYWPTCWDSWLGPPVILGDKLQGLEAAGMSSNLRVVVLCDDLGPEVLIPEVVEIPVLEEFPHDECTRVKFRFACEGLLDVTEKGDLGSGNHDTFQHADAEQVQAEEEQCQTNHLSNPSQSQGSLTKYMSSLGIHHSKTKKKGQFTIKIIVYTGSAASSSSNSRSTPVYLWLNPGQHPDHNRMTSGYHLFISVLFQLNIPVFSGTLRPSSNFIRPFGR
ncbi:hypothetical protein K438DRAFT_1963313 [Mycena galopus ATCC 62051]|nr:hypothetical protein K438DRAFT_1963313 [Mycena galopus ATCC 62051]